jgi:L,D-transpeptidase YcbB
MFRCTSRMPTTSLALARSPWWPGLVLTLGLSASYLQAQTPENPIPAAAQSSNNEPAAPMEAPASAPEATAAEPQARTAEPELATPAEAQAAAQAVMVLGEPLHNAASVLPSYSEPGSKALWFTASGNDASRPLLDFIANIHRDGLLPADYHQDALQRHCQSAKLTPELTNDCELLMADAFFTLADHLANGKVDPQSLTPEWKAKVKIQTVAPLFTALRQGQNAVDLLKSLRPKAPEYAAMMEELPKLQARLANVPAWPALALKPSIKDDMEDTRLPAIIERLQFWGDLDAQYTPSGRLDDTLQVALKQFQSRHGLETDGLAGKTTLQALNASPEFRLQQLISNLERWRWQAEDLGHKHIIVNIPSYELTGVIDNQVVLKKPVIVGRDTRRTPIFSSRISHIILNPNWNVPTKLAVEDKLPEIQRDPQFFSKLGITVYERDRVVDPAGVNWRRLGKGNFPFRLVQQPGPQNALGQVKFVIPNTDDIYLHDTPTRNLFNRGERAFSSGCIRVHKPMELALWLVAEQGWDTTKLDTQLAEGTTQTLSLKQPVPVHLRYWTVILDDQQQIRFRHDLYDRDLALWKALQQPLLPRTP